MVVVVATLPLIVAIAVVGVAAVVAKLLANERRDDTEGTVADRPVTAESLRRSSGRSDAHDGNDSKSTKPTFKKALGRENCAIP